jgi:putative ABC transport system permease protein
MLDLFRFLSIRYWLRHRGGFLLASLGVALGIAVFVAVQVANHSVLAAFSASLDAVTGKANLQIRGGGRGLPEELFARLRLRDDPDIEASAPILARTLYSPKIKTSLLVMGVDLFSEAGFRDYDLAAPDASAPNSQEIGGALRLLTDPRAIAISAEVARAHGLKTGDTLPFFIGSRRRDFTIVNVIGAQSLSRAYGGDFAILDIATAQEAFGQLGVLSRIDLRVREDKLPEVAARLRKMAPPDAIVQRPAQRGAQVAQMLAAFQLNLLALSCIAVFVGAFLIYNAIASAVVRRRAEVGILRAIGAGQAQIKRLFLLEAAAIGLIGSIAGLLLGVLMARFALGAVSTTVSQLYIAVKAREIVVPLWLCWGAPLGGTVLAVISAWPAAAEAAATSPRAAMTGATLHQAAARWAAPMAGGGLFMLLLALLLSQPAATQSTPYAGFGASFFILAGFALLTPLGTLWGGRLAQSVAGALFGIEGALAGASLQRALSRSSLAIAALMVSLAMTMGLSIMVRSFRATVADWVDNTISADLFVAPAIGFDGDAVSGLPHEVVTFAQALPGVRAIDTLRSTETEIKNQPVQILANELPSLQSGNRHLRFVATVRGEAAALRDFRENRAILVSERLSNLLQVRAGDVLPLATPRGQEAFRVAGVFLDYNPNSILYMPRPLYEKYWRDDGVDGLALYLEPAAPVAAVQAKFEKKFAARYQLALLPNREVRAQVFDTFDQTFAVTYALQLITVLVAAVGIFDILIALLLERRRELAMLRAVGASPAQIARMTYVEFGLIGLFAWVIGVAAGLCLAWQLIFVINRQFFGWTIFWTLPPSVLWQALALALIAAIGAGVLPVRAAIQSSPAAALHAE